MKVVEPNGLVFDVQGHSIHDGPGTRTLVFLSGCPLRCQWCSNPEGLFPRQRLMYKSNLCSRCPALCLPACSQGAVSRPTDGQPVSFDRTRCDFCETTDCVHACCTGALQTSGEWYSVDQLMRVLTRDRDYWGTEGGLTLTGGEPLIQDEFVLALLERCRDAYIHTCLETSAYISRRVLQAVLPLSQWLFVDIKHMDSARHREGTGVPNEPILDNIRWVVKSSWLGRMVLRMPVVPGFNDDLANAKATASFLAEIGRREINLLPFHRLGASKYEQLGTAYQYQDQASPDRGSLASLASVYEQRGITCYLGADTPF